MPKIRQVAALPVRRGADGSIEVCLVTTRATGRWVIPKGWTKANVPPAKMAAREAYEEAGLKGSVGKKPIGSYRYFKRFERTFELIRVDVFLLEVTREKLDYPEISERHRIWVKPDEAATMVAEPGLAVLIGRLPDNL